MAEKDDKYVPFGADPFFSDRPKEWWDRWEKAREGYDGLYRFVCLRCAHRRPEDGTCPLHSVQFQNHLIDTESSDCPDFVEAHDGATVR